MYSRFQQQQRLMMLNSHDLHVSAAKAPIDFRKRATVALVATLLLVLSAIAISSTPNRKQGGGEGFPLHRSLAGEGDDGKETPEVELNNAVAVLAAGPDSESLLPSRHLTLTMYPYERWPIAAGGTAQLIGGNGGNLFFAHAYGDAVKKVTAWTGSYDGTTVINCILVQTFKRKRFVIGSIPSGASAGEITFSPGERLTGDMILTGNGKGQRLGFIKFQTNNGQTFEVGSQKTPYIFDSKESYLMGFFGRANLQVDNLGFYMMKEIDDVKITDVIYNVDFDPNEQPLGQLVIPVQNNSPNPFLTTLEYERLNSSTKSWSVTASISVEVGITVQAGVPAVASVEGSLKITRGLSATWTNEEFVSTKTTSTSTAEVPSCSARTFTLTWFESERNIDYTGNVEYKYTDGTIFKLSVDGVYQGVMVTEAKISQVPVPLENPSAECQDVEDATNCRAVGTTRFFSGGCK
jgi:hypothetical protein